MGYHQFWFPVIAKTFLAIFYIFSMPLQVLAATSDPFPNDFHWAMFVPAISASTTNTVTRAWMPLNDTGIIWGGDYPDGNNSDCTGVQIGAQDCSHGRDVTHNDDSDGHAGFSLTKLGSNGVALTNQSANYSTDPWNCVRDNVTGLIWEVKTNDNGLHDRDNRYTWYNTDPTTNGGTDGYPAAISDTCYGYNVDDPTTYCNTQAYVARVNAAGWCGTSDWRMPTSRELLGILSFGNYAPAIDTDFFPNATSLPVWSGSPFAGDSKDAWIVVFETGYSQNLYRYNYLLVRLVRSGQ